MKVLVISRTVAKGGSASGVINLVNALRAVNNEVVVETADRKSIAFLFFRSIEYLFNRVLFEKGAHLFKFFTATINLKKLVDRHNPDIVQLCNISDNCINLNDIASLSVPVVHRLSDFWPYHGPSHYSAKPYKGLFTSPFFNFVNGTLIQKHPDIIVAPSTWTKSILKETGSASSLIEVIPNAVLSHSDTKKRVLQKQNVIKLGVISVNLNTPRKGIRNIVTFLEELNNFLPVELHIYGRGHVTALDDVAFKVIAHGPYQKEDMVDVFSSFDILIYPAYLENSANTITEALSMGVPVIAQNGTGNDFYIDTNVGFLFDFKISSVENKRHFNSIISKLIEDYPRYSEASMRKAKHEFSHIAVGKKYQKIYKDLQKIYLKERSDARHESNAE